MLKNRGRRVYVTKRYKKKKIVHDRYLPASDYLKYYKVVRYWVRRTYDITTPDLEMMFFLYSEGLFTLTKLREYENVFSWDSERIYRLKNMGMIHVWRKKFIGESQLYELTFKAKRIINSVYKKLNGEEPIPTSVRRNPVMRKNGNYKDKVFAQAILKFNKEFKERSQHLDQESPDT